MSENDNNIVNLSGKERDILQIALEQTRTRVEEEMDILLPKPLENLGESRLFEAMRYSVFAGGKRVRPLLVMATNELLGGVGPREERAVRVATAIEMLHTYSLIHDDLPCMDDDDLRRGKPTCHIKFDEVTAVLAGDALLTQSFEVLSHKDTHPKGDIRAELINILAIAAGPVGMVGGQMLDMLAEDVENFPLEEGELARLQRKKTGALFLAACDMAAVINHANLDVRYRLKSYARNIGLAFQMMDDVLDVVGTEEQLGKRVGSDEENNKATFVTLLGVEGAKRQAQLLCQQAEGQLRPFGRAADVLRLLARFIVSREF